MGAAATRAGADVDARRSRDDARPGTGRRAPRDRRVRPPHARDTHAVVHSGAISMTMHTHSSGFRGPRDVPTLMAETVPLRHPIGEQRFSYSSVACADHAPYNDVGLRFDPEHPGVRNPAAVRHLIDAAVTGVRDAGTTARVEGTLITYLCDAGERGDRIEFTFDGELQQQPDLARFREAFEITGGTGRFADIHGSVRCTGTSHAWTTCFGENAPRAARIWADTPTPSSSGQPGARRRDRRPPGPVRGPGGLSAGTRRRQVAPWRAAVKRGDDRTYAWLRSSGALRPRTAWPGPRPLPRGTPIAARPVARRPGGPGDREGRCAAVSPAAREWA